MYSLERAAGALAATCLATIVLLAGKPYFTNASRPPRGITDPGIAIQVARSLEEVDYILGSAPSPDREVMRLKQYIGFASVVLRTALFLILARLLAEQRGWRRVAAAAAMVCTLASALFATISKLAILRTLNVSLIETTPAMINSIRASSAAMWLLTAVSLALLSSYFFTSGTGNLVASLVRSLAGVSLAATAAAQLYGLHDNRFLVWQGFPFIAGLVSITAIFLGSLRARSV